MNILQLSYYPSNPVGTGGQRRITNLNKLLSSLGHRVTQLAICPKRDDVSALDIPLNRELDRWIFRSPYDFEIRIAEAVQSDWLFRLSVRKKLRSFGNELVWLEHPFLWPIVQRWLPQIPTIYSSHNVEWLSKLGSLKKQGIFDPRCIEVCRRNEEDLARKAKFVVCCSEEDRNRFANLNRRLVVIPNGSDPPKVTDPNAALHEIGPQLNLFDGPTFAFVSAYHEPNWFGFIDYVFAPFLRKPPKKKINIVIMGGVASLYENWRLSASLPRNVNVITYSPITENAKNYILLNSTAILLPITHGGGTNLKTAEALLSGAEIIATPMAFRGYERFHRHERVRMATTPDSFCDSIESTADTFYPAEGSCLSRVVSKDVYSVCWEQILAKAKPVLSEFIVGNRSC